MKIDDKVLSIARGDAPADLVLKNCQIIDVFTGSIYDGDIAIVDGYIVGIGDYSGATEIDIEKNYIAPGFIDGHVHIESSMVSPEQFAAALLPRGTTTVIADPHELANVYGTEAIDYFLKIEEEIPLDIYIMLPSCVPSTNLETSGAVLTHKDLEKFIGHPKVLGLGEMMNYPGVIYGDAKVWDKLNLFRNHNLLIDGHIQGTMGKPLCAYRLPGISSNHECITPEEAFNCLRMGMKLMIREGSAAKNLRDLLPVINKNTLSHCMLVTDDRQPKDIVKQGHLDYLIKLCIENGIEPIDAITMATINPAQYFGLKHLGAIAPGFQGDLVVIEDLNKFTIKKVYKKGILVGQEGKCTYELNKTDELKSPIILSTGLKVREITIKDLKLKLDGDYLQVIKIIPDQLLTEKMVIPKEKYTTGQYDIAKLVVIERHKATGNIGLGLVTGFNLKGGAIVSTVAHDSHNIVAIGDNDEDIVKAVKTVVELNGGLAVVKDGRVLASLSLPVGGLMSEEPLERVVEKVEQLEKAAQELNIPKELSPFMTLSFLSLPVIPHLRVTDKGLVDVDEFKIVELST